MVLCKRLAVALFLVAALALPALAVPVLVQGPLRVHFIDVGQGDSILIQTPAEQNVLIDAGPSDPTDRVIGYLRAHNVDKLDILVATHPHEDHIGEMPDVFAAFGVAELLLPNKPATTLVYKAMLAAANAKAAPLVYGTAGMSLALTGLTATVLGPGASPGSNVNNWSIVIRLTYGETAFLFQGDAETSEEKAILATGAAVAADVLKVGHHGSETSTSAAYLAAVAPDFAVISVGTPNPYGHPAAITLCKLSCAGVVVFRTDVDGTIEIDSDGITVSVATVVPEELAPAA